MKARPVTHDKHFEPFTLRSLTPANRIVRAPLMRNRIGAGFIPSDLATLTTPRLAEDRWTPFSSLGVL
jgi:2,4-dienoyl-CoA reductase-like NADH-dependent reductase (Old Yellow Enzyme family)